MPPRIFGRRRTGIRMPQTEERPMTPEPFRIDTPQPVLDRIQARLADSRIGYMPDDEEQWKYGMDARYLAELVAYWREDYDWRREEAELNRWPQYRVEIDGIPIHF